MQQPILQIRDLRTAFSTKEGLVLAVDGISFDMKQGETLGVVGESGSGKSVTALSIMRLIPTPPGRYVSGEILFQGKDLLKKSEREMRSIRGNEIAMIFQEPMTSLNPVHTIGSQIAESICIHQGVDRKKAWQQAVDLLRLVDLPHPEQQANVYPHQLSGGMRQRVMIAIAMACEPKLLIADEPTTALDVTIQAQVLDLMRDVQERIGTTTLIITHDLGVIAQMADRVIVMYAGKIVETSEVFPLFDRPYHPYTEGLLKSIPRLDQSNESKLHVIEGTVPGPNDMPQGCRFHPRCSYVTDICKAKEPPLVEVDRNRMVSCWHWDKVGVQSWGEKQNDK